MQWDESAAAIYKIEQGFFLVGFDFQVGRENEQAIKAREFRGIEVLQVLGVDQFDVFLCKDRLKLLVTISRFVVPIITEEQDPQFRSSLCGKRKQQKKCEEKCREE